MTEYQTLNVKIDDRGVAFGAMNRPEKRNALSSLMMDELTDIAETLGTDLNIRAIVLSGSGDIFCAGGDLDWMKEQIAADRETRMAEAGRLAAMLGALNTMPKPLIGRIHGAALGGGIGMACVCDVAIAQTGTKFGLTETRLGLIPATIGPYVIARMGEGFARRVFMSARIFGAEEAQTLGIIAKHVDAAEMDAAIDAEVEPYLNVAPVAVGAAKRLARGLGPVIDQAAIDYSIELLAETWEGEEAAHGLDAFLTKSAPRWAKPKAT
jgi:methylglutaconyl-CoA hydratase